MWEDVLKTRSHWRMLSSLEQNFVNFCSRVGLIYELTYPYGLGDHPNEYNRNYNEQYDFLYNLLDRVLNDAAKSLNPVHEKDISQPTPLGAESFRHHVTLAVEDASFYLLVQCYRTEPVEAYIFHTEMHFRVPKKFWGNEEKIDEIGKGIESLFLQNHAIYGNFAKKVIDNLDIEEVDEEESRGRISSKAPVREGTERERWWE